MTTRSTILGGYQSDFSRNLAREGHGISDLVLDVATNTLSSAGVDPEQVESIHVGNAFGQLYTGQGHLGAMPATVVPELWGIPAMRHEAACASASIATLAAMAEIEAGRYDCVLVVGVEQERTMPGLQAAQVQSAAAFVGEETDGSEAIWPAMFEQVAAEYDRRYGLDETYLRAIGQLNLINAKQNPNAQTRAWKLDAASFGASDESNPIVAGRLRRNDCCQITDGGAGIVLVSQRWLAQHGNDRQLYRRATNRVVITCRGFDLLEVLSRPFLKIIGVNVTTTNDHDNVSLALQVDLP